MIYNCNLIEISNSWFITDLWMGWMMMTYLHIKEKNEMRDFRVQKGWERERERKRRERRYDKEIKERRETKRQREAKREKEKERGGKRETKRGKIHYGNEGKKKETEREVWKESTKRKKRDRDIKTEFG